MPRPRRAPDRADTEAQADPPVRSLAQQRSRDRRDLILAVASDLIAGHGSDAMKMSEVAQRAGISIGSLYQYFPDKRAIIRALAERTHAESRTCIEAALLNVDDLEALQTAFAGLIDQYYALFLAEPVMRDIWSGTQADPELRTLELAESRACAALLGAILARIHPAVPRPRIDATALMVWQLGEAAMRLAISLEPAEGSEVVEAYKRMTRHTLAQP
ncbi:TetR family transcriptional regulator [Bradyrhizobium sp. U87765 SZCCT0131]|uniref:TetR/AcrR family transcriptional regulator n=1 Tax=unclassified Bradyrhizobium TaxID=2631580 RepID=UPI001BA577A3|nr:MULTISPECIES: TetR/AcrR family transcriptional regulator [unclassified Bradyrhizobium]MBR1217329.1 TetR family transcriptional regulator [Bradyrhizobium sp. U87765 SZCCT0131]MBR1265074.1 TetR family transcriptional regulator [Bradyrhizobium sp. U87765 SZCCT0134]MBR1305056.1 TetR family transcriptional regulator [Bradyrhizobium sp. U87765 SZCCT0110]MBR1320842.1 TetR family transcriptional regulator [Bradyrhizobium sp. U87765 SZCCT0109]MBR1349262.1 TetR family transcriptional regulator [Brady